jgi:hypothetical protein
MNTKTLLIAAAALAAGIMTSQAQVYSQNIVGYINVPLPAGQSLIANQLDFDGTGLHNSIYTAVGTNLPVNSQVLAWSGGAFTTSKLLANHTWSGAANVVFTNAMNPGGGFFISVPVATNVTFVGNVITGTNTYPITAGFQIVAPSGPVAGTIDGTNGYTPSKVGAVGDQILVWGGLSYTTHKWLGSSWSGGDPQLAVGQSVFLDAVVNTNWTQVLNVQ